MIGTVFGVVLHRTTRATAGECRWSCSRIFSNLEDHPAAAIIIGIPALVIGVVGSTAVGASSMP